MIVWDLTTSHTQSLEIGVYVLFYLIEQHSFVTYLTGAVYVHPLWFYKHQHDNRVHSKLFVACQRWWFQCRFWFVPSVLGYLQEEEEHKPDSWRNPIERNHMRLHLENEVKTPTVIFNNPVFNNFQPHILRTALDKTVLADRYNFKVDTAADQRVMEITSCMFNIAQELDCGECVLTYYIILCCS